MRSNICQVLGEHSVSQVLAMQTPRPGFCPENSLKSQSWCQELTVLTVGRQRHLGLTGQSVQPKYQSSKKPCLKKEGGRQLGNDHQCQLAYVLQVTCAHVYLYTCKHTQRKFQSIDSLLCQNSYNFLHEKPLCSKYGSYEDVLSLRCSMEKMERQKETDTFRSNVSSGGWFLLQIVSEHQSQPSQACLFHVLTVFGELMAPSFANSFT